MHQMSMWADIKSNGFLNTSTSMLVEMDTKLDNQVHLQFSYVKLHIQLYTMIVLAILLIEICLHYIVQSEDTSHETLGHPNKYDQETNKPVDKVMYNALPSL